MTERQPVKARRPRRATAAYLERVALFLLGRQSTTSARLRRALQRRVDRSARAHGTDAAEGRALAEALVERLTRVGLLDDARFARDRAESLLGRGTSPRAIAYKLKALGVEPAEIQAALGALRASESDPELAAAIALARRRRLGPYATAKRQSGRELAVLVRAGFSFSVAKRVLEGPVV